MYEIEPKSLVFSSGRRCRFAGDIAEVLTFDESMVIRLVDNPISVLHNVFGVDYRGNILWQIPSPVTFTLQRPYVSVTVNHGRVDAVNWDGHVVTLNVKSGTILKEEYCTNESGPNSRRVFQPRHWL